MNITFKNSKKLWASALISFLLPLQSNAQFAVSPNKTAAQLASALTGPGVTITNATLSCPAVSNGTYTGGSGPLGIANGILLTTGSAGDVNQPSNILENLSTGAAGDPSLTALSGNPTFDACVLEFDFVPLGDTVAFRYQFGSEEYDNFTCTQFNDIFAFWISGPGYATPTNIAKVPGTNIPVAINSVNGGVPTGNGVLSNCTSMGVGSPFPAYFTNYGSTANAPVYNGYTHVFDAKAAVTPCSTYHFKMGVADASDRLLSSGVFIEQGSLTILPPVITGCPGNINSATDMGECGAIVSWTEPSVSANCLNVTVNQSHQPGDFFAVGTTTVTYEYTNAGGTSTCSFDVIVTDTESPVALCTNYTLNLVNGMGTVMPSQIDGGSTDNCGIVNAWVMPNSFTCADAGAQMVHLFVEDAEGHVDSCMAEITVQYQPSCSIVSIPSDTTYTGGIPTNIYIGYGPQSTTLDVTALGGTGFTYSWSPSTDLSCNNCEDPVFTPTAEGNYTFEVTVTNSNGCSTTCDITICVKDIRVANQLDKKVYICHTPDGNSANQHTLAVAIPAVPQHLSMHSGDLLGTCDNQCGMQARPSSIVGVVEELAVQAFPNPFSMSIQVQIMGTTDPAVISLLDVTGKIIEQKNVSSHQRKIDMGQKAVPGIYFIEVSMGDYRERIKVVKTL